MTTLFIMGWAIAFITVSLAIIFYIKFRQAKPLADIMEQVADHYNRVTWPGSIVANLDDVVDHRLKRLMVLKTFSQGINPIPILDIVYKYIPSVQYLFTDTWLPSDELNDVQKQIFNIDLSAATLDDFVLADSILSASRFKPIIVENMPWWISKITQLRQQPVAAALLRYLLEEDLDNPHTTATVREALIYKPKNKEDLFSEPFYDYLVVCAYLENLHEECCVKPDIDNLALMGTVGPNGIVINASTRQYGTNAFRSKGTVAFLFDDLPSEVISNYIFATPVGRNLGSANKPAPVVKSPGDLSIDYVKHTGLIERIAKFQLTPQIIIQTPITKAGAALLERSHGLVKDPDISHKFISGMDEIIKFMHGSENVTGRFSSVKTIDNNVVVRFCYPAEAYRKDNKKIIFPPKMTKPSSFPPKVHLMRL